MSFSDSSRIHPARAKQASLSRFRCALLYASLLFSASEQKRFRLASLWPEWSDAEINAEPWDMRRRDTGQSRGRQDAKQSSSAVSDRFDS